MNFARLRLAARSPALEPPPYRYNRTVSDVPASAPYRDASLPVEKRVRDLLERMTLAEKIAQLTSVWLQLEPGGAEFAPFQGTFARPRPVRLEHGIGQITRPLGSRPIDARDGARALNAFQRRLVECSRWVRARRSRRSAT
jgi:beta-glucosidase